MTTDRSHTRSNFLGGEWSPSALGRIDLPTYDQSLSVSYNGYPIEEGSWTKRGGSMLIGATNNGYNGIVRTWYIAPKGSDTTQVQSVLIEVSYGPGATGGTCTIQIWQYPFAGNAPVFSGAAPYTSLAEVNQLEFIATDLGVFFLSKTTTPYILTYNVTSDVFTFQDANFKKLNGPYLDALVGNSLTNNSTGSVDGTGSGGTITFTITDGAYSFVASDVNRAMRLWNQPPQWDPSTAYNPGDVVYQDGQFWSALPIWNGASTVGPPVGNVPGTTASIANTTHNPITIVPWVLEPQQGTWGYGWIQSVTNATTCVMKVILGLPSAKVYGSSHANGLVIDTWQLGVYTVGQYPAMGCWHEGRLWLGGALPNRIDASKANGMNVSLKPGGDLIGTNGALGPLFSPTDTYGQVVSDNGISEVFNSDGNNMPIWMIPEQSGILMGTAGAEWLIAATNQNDILSPTSIQIHKITKYGAIKTHAIRVGIAIAYIQAYGRRVIELVADVFSGRFIGRHLNEYAKHLTSSQFRELAYQEEPAPLIWARDGAGKLYSCTYRRVSHFGQEDPKFMGWSRHELSRWSGPSRVMSLCDTAIPGVQSGSLVSSLSSVAMVTGQPTGNINIPFSNCQIELIHPNAEPDSNAWNVWHLDGGTTGTFGQTINMSDAGRTDNSLQIGGIPSIYIGKTVSVYLCGLDFGDYVVDFAGTVVVPYASDPDKIGTQAWIIANYVPLGSTNVSWGEWTTGANIGGHACWLPCVLGFNYTSQVQVSRPYAGEASAGKTGPAFGKLEKTYMWGATFAHTSSSGLVVSAKQTTAGITAANAADPNVASQIIDFPVVLRYPTNAPIPASTLFSGVFWDTINGDYNFDNQITLTSSRPVPLTVASLTSFMAVEDR